MMDSEQEEKKSRSQLKREFEELKELVKQLVALTPGQLQSLPLSEGTHDAILAAHKLTRSPLKRQLRHLAGRMEDEDVEAIRSAMSGTPSESGGARVPDAAEGWGEELIAGDDQSLSAFIEDHPEFDRQRLRQLVRNARKERDLDKPSNAARRLRQYLKSPS